MSNISPKNRIGNSVIPGITIKVPAVTINGNAVIRVAHEHIINDYVTTTHQVNAIAPAIGAEGFQIADRYIFGAASINSIMLWINHDDALYRYIIGMPDLNSPLLLVNNASPGNPHIVHPVAYQFSSNHSSSCYINCFPRRDRKYIS